MFQSNDAFSTALSVAHLQPEENPTIMVCPTSALMTGPRMPRCSSTSPRTSGVLKLLSKYGRKTTLMNLVCLMFCPGLSRLLWEGMSDCSTHLSTKCKCKFQIQFTSVHSQHSPTEPPQQQWNKFEHLCLCFPSISWSDPGANYWPLHYFCRGPCSLHTRIR